MTSESANDDSIVEIHIEVPEISEKNSTNYYSEIDVRGPREFAAKLAGATGGEQYAAVMKLACATAAETYQSLSAMDAKAQPDEFEISFALSVDAQADVRIAQLGSSAQVQVRMQWNRGTGA
jgi:hypothetical protein